MILSMMPFAPDMNLGRAYNEAMDLLPSEDSWAVFLDHDAMWTTRRWWSQVAEVAAAFPDAGAVTSVTNRIASPWQKAGDPDCHDVAVHRKFGLERTKVRTLLDVTDTQGIGGVVIAISKASWRLAGGFADGMYCVDHSIHFRLRDAGRRVYVHEGLYVYHWRRANGDGPPANAPRAYGCPCRGPEKNPTRRVELP